MKQSRATLLGATSLAGLIGIGLFMGDVGLTQVPLGYQQITLAGATGLTVPAGAKMAVIVPESNNVRWRDDGVLPTGTAGMLMATGQVPYIYVGTLTAIQFIQTAGTATLNVSYYK